MQAACPNFSAPITGYEGSRSEQKAALFPHIYQSLISPAGHLWSEYHKMGPICRRINKQGLPSMSALADRDIPAATVELLTLAVVISVSSTSPSVHTCVALAGMVTLATPLSPTT